MSRQVDGPLAVREDELAYIVVHDDDPADWLVRFEKASDFEAQEWAEHMVHTYNERLRSEDDHFVRVTARSPELGPRSG